MCVFLNVYMTVHAWSICLFCFTVFSFVLLFAFTFVFVYSSIFYRYYDDDDCYDLKSYSRVCPLRAHAKNLRFWELNDESNGKIVDHLWTCKCVCVSGCSKVNCSRVTEIERYRRTCAHIKPIFKWLYVHKYESNTHTCILTPPALCVCVWAYLDFS